MNIYKILLLIIIILIFYLYNNNIIEGIDILNNSDIPYQDWDELMRNVESINEKKILIKINESKLSSLTIEENNSIKNKKFIARIASPTNRGNAMRFHNYEGLNYDGDFGKCLHEDGYITCYYGITTIDNYEIVDSIFSKLRPFFENSYSFIPSKSFNKRKRPFGQNYLYESINLSIMNIVNYNDANDYIHLEIINYVDDSGNPLKNDKEKIKKYIYSQFFSTEQPQ